MYMYMLKVPGGACEEVMPHSLTSLLHVHDIITCSYSATQGLEVDGRLEASRLFSTNYAPSLRTGTGAKSTDHVSTSALL